MNKYSQWTSMNHVYVAVWQYGIHVARTMLAHWATLGSWHVLFGFCRQRLHLPVLVMKWCEHAAPIT